MPFVTNIPGGKQVRAHGTSGKCLSAYCPCNARGMVSQAWAYRKHGGEQVVDLLVKNWVFRFERAREQLKAEQQLARSREALSKYQEACKASQV